MYKMGVQQVKLYIDRTLKNTILNPWQHPNSFVLLKIPRTLLTFPILESSSSSSV